MSKSKWRAYSDLAWTELIVGPPEEYIEETELLSKVIKEHSKIETRTLLHLGCGAGGNDYTFKRHFEVTGVDISENMLEIARELNPEVTYLSGDMRTLQLDECFDAVTIPDSIGYMTQEEDLRNAILTAHKHLKPGGVLQVVVNTRGEFKENNFVYTGSNGDIEITVFENNYILDSSRTSYEAIFVYLIRCRGKLEIHTDRHIISLFKLDTWLSVLKEAGLDIKQMKMEHSYDHYILGEGEYPLTMFVCNKPL